MFERMRRVEPGGTSQRLFLQTDSTDSTDFYATASTCLVRSHARETVEGADFVT